MRIGNFLYQFQIINEGIRVGNEIPGTNLDVQGDITVAQNVLE
jgi:hypothetical protein